MLRTLLAFTMLVATCGPRRHRTRILERGQHRSVRSTKRIAPIQRMGALIERAIA